MVAGDGNGSNGNETVSYYLAKMIAKFDETEQSICVVFRS